jgi:hypothetical protein
MQEPTAAPCATRLPATNKCRALLRDPEVAWSAIPDLPKAAAVLLEARFARMTSSVLSVQRSGGGDTTKLLIQLQDGQQVEAVVMNYDTTERYGLAGGERAEAGAKDSCSSGGGDGESSGGAAAGGGARPGTDPGAPSTSGREAMEGSGGGGGGGGGGHKRGTLCVSSQVGCQMGCTFCATGEARSLGRTPR